MTAQEQALTGPVPGVRNPGRLASYASLLRVRQWVKNAFVLAGAFFSDQLFHASTVKWALAATLAFCFLSSAVYAFNDIVDREADAAHPSKRHRPLVVGTVTVREAVVLIVVLLLLSAGTIAAIGFPWQVHTFFGIYFGINILYSLFLKHFSLIDVLVIAAGFVLRLEAGIFAVRVTPSSWIVLCTGLLSLFLALAKRRGDLLLEEASHRQSLRGYSIAYIDLALAMMGSATVVVYALFTVSDYAQLRFHAPLLYLTTFPVVMGILRYLQITIVEGRYASPADVVLRDRAIQFIFLVWIALFFVFVYR